jgi:two-component system cell cycle sensor histidine kinase/response regulator CckA
MNHSAPSPVPVNRRVLIVDDNPAIHDDFRKILGGAGPEAAEITDAEAVLFGRAPAPAALAPFELTSAHQGEEALALVEDSITMGCPFALAFMDVRMPPGWDGIETIERIWKVYPELQVVICTAFSDYSWQDIISRLGHSENLVILKKPFDNIEVLQLAHALTNKWRLNRLAHLRQSELESTVETRTRQLSLSEERFAVAFQASPAALAVVALTDARLIEANDRFLRLLQLTREEANGRPVAELPLSTKPEQFAAWLTALAGGESIHERPAHFARAGGEPRETLVSMELLSFSGAPHALVQVQDITERVELERQLRQAQKMDAIGQLAAGVAHDFNNILTVIQGHAGLLNQILGPEGRHHKSVDAIARASNRAAALIRQLLLFSRKQVLQSRNISLNDVIASTVSMLHRLVGEHISIELDPQDGLPAVHADVGMLEQVLVNFTVNARDAMPNGGRIHISTRLASVNRGPTREDDQARAGDYLCMAFTDTGCGMDSTVLKRVFEPFFTTKGVGKGTGLGLATVYGIARQHKGWIEVESEVGQGSTFKLFLPPSAQPAEALNPDQPEQAGRPGSETILIAEDEAALRDMIAQVLTVQGYKVLTAASGVEALRVWENSPRNIDLLITDMVMPGGILGGELADRLMEANPRLKVIYTSGYSPGFAGKEPNLRAGTNFLPKPYELGRLTTVVRECLDAPVANN